MGVKIQETTVRTRVDSAELTSSYGKQGIQILNQGKRCQMYGISIDGEVSTHGGPINAHLDKSDVREFAEALLRMCDEKESA